jgi:hypothetical protein
MDDPAAGMHAAATHGKKSAFTLCPFHRNSGFSETDTFSQCDIYTVCSDKAYGNSWFILNTLDMEQPAVKQLKGRCQMSAIPTTHHAGYTRQVPTNTTQHYNEMIYILVCLPLMILQWNAQSTAFLQWQ